MTAQQLKNAILQDLFLPKDYWEEKELKEIVSKQCPISYGIVQQGNHVEGGVPVVRPVDLHCKFVGRDSLKCTSLDISESYSRTVLSGDEILLCVRGTTGIMALATKELAGCNVNRGIVPLFFDKNVDRLFIYYQLQTPKIQEAIASNTMGSALRQINIKDLRTLLLNVPPLAEQQRIVAKIEELLPKVEEYGKAQEKLNKLNEELPERLKKSILQEAIEGRLVKQDPNDEPASALLAKIREEKKRLVKEGKLKKKDLEEKPISEDEIPFEIPESWEWVRLITLSKYIHYGYTASAAPKGNSKLLRITDIQDDKVNWTSVPFCIIKDNDLEKYQLHNRDILIARTGGTIGKTYIVRELNELAVFASYLIRAIPLESVYEKYLKLFMGSPCYWTQLTDAASGTGQPNVNGQSLSNLIVPLPPLAEQHRIVAKVEQLLKEINKLKQ